VSFRVTGSIGIGGGGAPADAGVAGNFLRLRTVPGVQLAGGRTLLPEFADYEIAEDGTWAVDVEPLPAGHAYEWVFVLGGGRWASRARLTAAPTANTTYGALVDVTAPSLPGYVPPPWAADVLSARDAVAADKAAVNAKATAAASSASAAAGSASAADSSASAAAGSASGATSAAGVATSAASAADASAMAAAGSASAASGSATAAAGSATEAAGSATAATEARTGAEDARDETIVQIAARTDWAGAATLTRAQTKSQFLKRRLTGNVVLTVNSGEPGLAYSTTLKLTQDATGGRTLVLANVASSYGVAIPLTASSNATDTIRLEWDGEVWSAYLGGQQMLIPTSWVV
jgi:hypothetical protein